ncbi:unnamed protein product [Blepharisma stoltei]|uniref:Uncharacterized protein n=1 Tax=Blepharisma stoltei TaxID=1481888 RepID=A0AAU9J2Z8_9CILI|nr:unnamed protein product [Blepharisma stoltei]
MSRVLEAVFFGMKDPNAIFYTRALSRAKKGVITRKEQAEISSRHISSMCVRFIGAPISIAVAYYIPIPDFFYPIFWRSCTFILCYRSITIPVLLKNRNFLKEIAIKYDLLNKPELLNPPKGKIDTIDQRLDSGKDGNNETFAEYIERIKETEKRLREEYEFDKHYKKSVRYESYEEYRDRKLAKRK